MAKGRAWSREAWILVAVDAASVGAGLQEPQRRLDFPDLSGVHLEQSDVELDLELLGGAFLVVGADGRLLRWRLPERAALFPQELLVRAKEPLESRMSLRQRIVIRDRRRHTHSLPPVCGGVVATAVPTPWLRAVGEPGLRPWGGNAHKPGELEPRLLPSRRVGGPGMTRRPW